MRYQCGILLCLIGVVFWFPSPARTDMTPVILVGGAVSPKSQHETIRMESEQIVIRLKQHTYTVDAVFHFFNTGNTTTEWVGFPKQGDIWTGLSTDVLDLIRFDTWVDGRKVGVSEEGGPGKVGVIATRALQYLLSAGGLTGVFHLGLRPIKEDRWLVQHVTFSGHARTAIRTSYEAKYVWGWTPAYYILGTGRHWKGSIGKATFIIDATDVGGTRNISVEGLETIPGPRTILDNMVMFEIGHIEPPPSAKVTINLKASRTRRSSQRVSDSEKHSSIRSPSPMN